MEARLIDGRKVSKIILDDLKHEASQLKKKYNRQVGLAVVIVGDDPASHVYVSAKEKIAKEIGFLSKKIILSEGASQQELLKVIYQLNNDESIHGILVQSPLPQHIDENKIILNIKPEKDVDCFHPYNVGKILIGQTDGFIPCTPSSCIELLHYYDISTEGKNVTIIGRSNIVGKPLASLLMQKNANSTVTVCHSYTKDIATHTSRADIVISALGRAKFLKENMIKKGAVVIDVGINRIKDSTRKLGYRLVGDSDFDNLKSKCSWLTPVPGGVGPMTIAMLMKNTLLAFKKRLDS